MKIPQAELDRIKREVSLVRLVEAKGIKLTGHGDNLLGRCIFHDDRTPSLVISPSKNIWNCLGACQTGGSVIDWVMRAEKVSFRLAVEMLRKDAPSLAAAPKAQATPLEPIAEPDEPDDVVLKRVIGYYHATLKESPEALGYLETRGLRHPELIEHFQLGYANRTLGYRMPTRTVKAGAALRAQLQRIGLYRESGHEHFAGSLIIPVLDDTGRVREVYGRKLRDDLRPGTPRHLYLPSRPEGRGIFNAAALKASKEVILCESLIDALTFWCADFRHVTTAYGVAGFTQELRDALREHGVEKLLIAYDRDEAGDRAAEKLAPELAKDGLQVFRVLFPRGMDANEYGRAIQPARKAFETAIRAAQWMAGARPVAVPDDLVSLPPHDPITGEIFDAPGRPRAAERARPRSKAPVESTAPDGPAEAAAAPEPSPRIAETGDATLGPTAGIPGVEDATSKTDRAATTAAAELEAAGEGQADTDGSSTTASTSPEGSDPRARRPSAAPANEGAVAKPNPRAAGALESSTAREPSTPVLAAPPAPESRPAAPKLDVDVRAEEVRISLGDRRWRIRGLAKNTSYESLRLNLLVARGDDFFVDTLELYSARQRVAFTKAAAAELGVDELILKSDLGKIVLRLEDLVHQQIEVLLKPKKTSEMSEEERVEALELLRDPRLMDRVLEDFDRSGIVGEEANKLIGYLAAVSRKLEAPLAVVIQSSSAAGKSALMDAVLRFMPEEERVQYSAMTGQSLFYMGETDLAHKILAIAEEQGAQSAAYALKLLQSEGQLTIASTGKDPATGKLVTHQYRVQGPVMIFLTTTAIEIDEELLNRCLILTVDEGTAQTAAIHARQRDAQTLEGILAKRERDARVIVHKNAQRLLEPLFVANPFAKSLRFASHSTRTRRDHMKYLTLIRAIALLHQHQRPIKEVEHRGQRIRYVEVVERDIAIADRLAGVVLGHGLDELPPHTRTVLEHIDALVTERAEKQGIERSAVRFTRRDIREYIRQSHTQLRIHLLRLEELEYLLIHAGGGKRRFVYELAWDRASRSRPGGNGAQYDPILKGAGPTLKGGWRMLEGGRPLQDFANPSADKAHLEGGAEKALRTVDDKVSSYPEHGAQGALG